MATKAIVKERFDWSAFKGNGNIAVHCQTEEEAKQFLSLMDEHGMTWINGDRYKTTSTRWSKNNERTCYHGSGQYGNIDYANRSGCTLFKFSLLDFD